MKKFTRNISRYMAGLTIGIACLSVVGYTATADDLNTRGGIGVLFNKLTSPDSNGYVNNLYRLDGANIQDNTVTSVELKDDTITTKDIKNGTILNEDINSLFSLWNKTSSNSINYIDGSVGIGTDNPLSSLYTNGGIRSKHGGPIYKNDSNVGYSFADNGDTGMFMTQNSESISTHTSNDISFYIDSQNVLTLKKENINIYGGLSVENYITAKNELDFSNAESNTYVTKKYVDDQIDAIKKQISNLKKSIDNQISDIEENISNQTSEVNTKISKIETNITNLTNKITTIEGSITNINTTITGLTPPVCTGTNKALQYNGSVFTCVKISGTDGTDGNNGTNGNNGTDGNNEPSFGPSPSPETNESDGNIAANISGELVIYEKSATLTVTNTDSNELWGRVKEEKGSWSTWAKITNGRSVCGGQQRWQQNGDTYEAFFKSNDCPAGYNKIIDDGVNYQQVQFATANPNTDNSAKISNTATLYIKKPKPIIYFTNNTITVSKPSAFNFYGCVDGTSNCTPTTQITKGRNLCTNGSAGGTWSLGSSRATGVFTADCAQNGVTTRICASFYKDGRQSTCKTITPRIVDASFAGNTITVKYPLNTTLQGCVGSACANLDSGRPLCTNGAAGGTWSVGSNRATGAYTNACAEKGQSVNLCFKAGGASDCTNVTVQ